MSQCLLQTFIHILLSNKKFMFHLKYRCLSEAKKINYSVPRKDSLFTVRIYTIICLGNKNCKSKIRIPKTITAKVPKNVFLERIWLFCFISHGITIIGRSSPHALQYIALGRQFGFARSYLWKM